MEEVTAAMDMRIKKANPTNKPAAPIPSNNAGRTWKIRSGPAIRLPLSEYTVTPNFCATKMAGRTSRPAKKAIDVSVRVTRAPTVGRFSSARIYEP